MSRVFDRVLIARRDSTAANIGSIIGENTITFECVDLPYTRGTYQWVVKNNLADADGDSIAADNGTLTDNRVVVTFNITDSFTVGNTYYFALRVTTGDESQEVIQVAFTVAQKGVDTTSTDIDNPSRLNVGSFTSAQRDGLVLSNAAIIYNTDDEQLQQYNPDTETWGAIGGSDPDAIKYTAQTPSAAQRAIAQINVGIDIRFVGEKTLGYGVNADYRIHSSAYPDVESAFNAFFSTEAKGTILKIQSDSTFGTQYKSSGAARVLTRPGYFLDFDPYVTLLNADSPQYNYTQVTVANEASRGTASNTMYYAIAEESYSFWDGSQYRNPENPVFFDDDSNYYSLDDTDFLVFSGLKILGNADASLSFGAEGNRQYNQGVSGGSSLSISNSHIYFLDCNLKNAVRYNSFIGTGTFGNDLTGTFNFTKNSKYVTITGGAALSELSEGDTLRTNTEGNVSFPVARVLSDTDIELKYSWVYNDLSSVVKKNRRVRLIEINSKWGATRRDDTHGGGVYRDSIVTNCIYENAGGYGIGSTNWIDSLIQGVECRNNVNGGGFERAAGLKIFGSKFYENSSKGLQLINGSQDNTVRDCDAYGNDDGFQDANFSTDRGQNRGNRYYNCRAYMNNQHGARIVALKDGYCNFIAYNNYQNRDGTLSLGAGVAATGTSEYNTENTVFECETFDDQNTPTQSSGLYLDSKCDRCIFDLAKVDTVQYPTLDYPQNARFLNPATITLLSATTARELLPHELRVRFPGPTLTLTLPRVANLRSDTEIKVFRTGTGSQTIDFVRNAGDGGLSSIDDYPSVIGEKGHIFWTLDKGSSINNRWRVESYQYSPTPFDSLSDYADDSAAAAGGIAIGQTYRTGSIIKVRVT